MSLTQIKSKFMYVTRMQIASFCLLLIILFLATAFSNTDLVTNTRFESGTTIPPQIPNSATYIIYMDGSIIKAENESTGEIEFTGTDISVILTSVNNTIMDSGTVLIKEGIYTPSSAVTFTKSIKLIADGNVIFNWNKQNQDLFVFSGSELSTTTLKADIVSGTNTVSVANVGTAVAGDLLLIYDNTIWNPTVYPSWKTGELHEILSIYGNTITITDGTINSFQVANSGSIKLIKPITVEVNGITINGGSATADYRGIKLYYNKNSIIRNGKFQNNGLHEIYIEDSYNTTVYNNIIGNNIMAGYGYGISIGDSSAYTTITNNYCYSSRHCVTLGGNGVVGQSRETLVSLNIFANSAGTDAVLDSHAAAESYYIYNNTIYSPSNQYAIQSSAKVTKVIDNTIIGGLGCSSRDIVSSPGYIYEIIGNTFNNSKYIFQYHNAIDQVNQTSIKDNIIHMSSDKILYGKKVSFLLLFNVLNWEWYAELLKVVAYVWINCLTDNKCNITDDIRSIEQIYNTPSLIILGNEFNST